VNAVDVLPLILLMVLSVALAIGLTMSILMFRRPRLSDEKFSPPPAPETSTLENAYKGVHCYVQRPVCWVAVRKRSTSQVQAALGLGNPRPCSLLEGLAGDVKLFIAPPVRGWVLILGTGLPDPTEDPDKCFRFITGLSRKLGHVQLFSASRILQHHAWVRADKGRIERAYAWAGQTVWNQGKSSSVERSLGLVCPDYLEALPLDLNQGDSPSANVDKVPVLAAKWSIDPGGIEDQLLETGRGITGEWSCRY
jgi:hypothetical protein